MRIDALITLVALIGMIIAIVYIIRLGRRDAEYIFESDYYNLQQFIHECPVTTENKIKIHKRFLEMEKMKGFNLEKMHVLWGEYVDRFSVTSDDIMAMLKKINEIH